MVVPLVSRAVRAVRALEAGGARVERRGHEAAAVATIIGQGHPLGVDRNTDRREL